MAHDGEKELVHDTRFIELVLKFEPITTKASPLRSHCLTRTEIPQKQSALADWAKAAYQHQLLIRG